MNKATFLKIQSIAWKAIVGSPLFSDIFMRLHSNPRVSIDSTFVQWNAGSVISVFRKILRNAAIGEVSDPAFRLNKEANCCEKGLLLPYQTSEDTQQEC